MGEHGLGETGRGGFVVHYADPLRLDVSRKSRFGAISIRNRVMARRLAAIVFC